MSDRTNKLNFFVTHYLWRLPLPMITSVIIYEHSWLHKLLYQEKDIWKKRSTDLLACRAFYIPLPLSTRVHTLPPRSRNVFLRVTDVRKYCYYSSVIWSCVIVMTGMAICAHFLLDTSNNPYRYLLSITVAKHLLTLDFFLGWCWLYCIFLSISGEKISESTVPLTVLMYVVGYIGDVFSL